MTRRFETPPMRSSPNTPPSQSIAWAASDPNFSFVIPVLDEAETIEELVTLIDVNVPVMMSYEIIMIDDGSSDASWELIQALAESHPDSFRGIRFRGRRGKANALQAGFDLARGNIVFTMDADLQDDPREIPRFLEKIDDGFDLVSGWKAVRHDPWHKVLPSRIFNRMLSYFSQVHLHDHNCGFKCYRRSVIKNIALFGELHRMTPSLAGMQGFRITEIVVQHHPRRRGVSKYGIERFLRGFSDMLTMGFLRTYRERPSHFTNFCASHYAVLAVMFFLSAWSLGLASIAGLVCFLTGFIFVGFCSATMIAGLLAELLIRSGPSEPTKSIVGDTIKATFANRQTSAEQCHSVPSAIESPG